MLVTETEWPIELKVFIAWPFTESLQTLFYTRQLHSLCEGNSVSISTSVPSPSPQFLLGLHSYSCGSL